MSCCGDEKWFISCMFTCSILFYGILIVREKIDYRYQNGLSLSISVILMMLGYSYKMYQSAIEEKIERLLWIIPCTLLYVFSAVTIQNNVDIHAERFTYPVVFFIMSLLAILPIIYLAKSIYRHGGSRGLEFLGKNTLFYYAFSGIGRIVFFEIFAYVSTSYMQPIFSTFFSIVLLAWPAWFINKYFSWAVGK